MATRQTGDGLASQVAAMSKPQLYDLMSQMKVLIEQNQDKARQILIDNPVLTRTLFQAQIMLGMVQPPKVMPNIQQVISQTELSKPTEPDPLPLPPPPAVQPKPQTLIHQQQPSFNNPQYLPPPPPPPSTPPPLHLSTPQLSGPINPQLSGLNNPQLAAPQFNMQSTHFNQPPPPMPHQQGRMQQFPNQMAPHQQMMMSNNSMGFQGGAQPQQMMPPPQPPMYHPGGIPQSSFPQVQPPLPSQPSPRQLYQGGAHMNPEYGGMPMQSDRPGPPWTTSGQMPGPPPPFMPGQQQMAPRPPQLTQDMEKNLLQQVMSLTPDQINMLAPDQRHQVLQLQEMLSRN